MPRKHRSPLHRLNVLKSSITFQRSTFRGTLTFDDNGITHAIPMRCVWKQRPFLIIVLEFRLNSLSKLSDTTKRITEWSINGN